ncbi:MAG: hypothetical protein RBS80_16225 [Thermoguttaceae bacterium]|jgi:hypothetical protein|nr:hypothetical protein [Thermoguttaceae bacterium]
MRRSRYFATLTVAVMLLTVCGRNHADQPPDGSVQGRYTHRGLNMRLLAGTARPAN